VDLRLELLDALPRRVALGGEARRVARALPRRNAEAPLQLLHLPAQPKVVRSLLLERVVRRRLSAAGKRDANSPHTTHG